MVIAGDLNSARMTHRIVAQTLGSDYPQYGVVGNHDVDREELIDSLRQYYRAAIQPNIEPTAGGNVPPLLNPKINSEFRNISQVRKLNIAVG